METVRVLQLGKEDFSKSLQIAECAEWYFEPDFSELPEKDFDVAVLDREIAADEFDYLMRFVRAYCLFVTEKVPLKKGEVTRRLYVRKMGKRISAKGLPGFLKDDLPDYFSGSYGEKFQPQSLSIAQGFEGKVSWRGFERVELEGDYGSEMAQIAFWRLNIPLEVNNPVEFWLEYKKDDTVEIVLEVLHLQYGYGTDPIIENVWTFSEKELQDVVYIENRSTKTGYAFVTLKARGHGRLKIIALHDRHSRRGKGNFIPGGGREVTSNREEIFYYFDPGNLKPPLNIYFSGYRTQEGFEGYNMMRKMGHPFLLFADPRLEGGACYIGSEEYEDRLEQIIRRFMKKLRFQNSDVIMSGLSMGTFGALYYGCRIHPNTILLGKPLASMGDVADNTRINNPDGSATWVDVLYREYESLSREAIGQLNDRFWNQFDQTDWSGTRFAVSYMIEDDMDGNAYENLQSHLKDGNAKIYGKGLHGRHNDNTPGIVGWFTNQYQEIIRREFDGI